MKADSPSVALLLLSILAHACGVEPTQDTRAAPAQPHGVTAADAGAVSSAGSPQGILVVESDERMPPIDCDMDVCNPCCCGRGLFVDSIGVRWVDEDACRVQLTAAELECADEFDLDRVNGELEGVVLSYVDDASQCSDEHGWAYVGAPSSGTFAATQADVLLCGVTCAAYSNGAELRFVMGCQPRACPP